MKKYESLITPLASIFGSGFLVIAPILASVAGKYAVIAMIVICITAYAVGGVIRYNIKNVEPTIENDKASKLTLMLEQVSDIVLVPAYVISITLYLKILASFLLDPFNLDTHFYESVVVTVILLVILAVSLFKGLDTLNFLEKYALLITIVIMLVLLVFYFKYDTRYLSEGFTWIKPNRSLFDKIRVIAGTLIVVQGFETTRYQGYKYDATTRINACKNSQLISTAVYIVFVLLATPIMFNIDLTGAISTNKLIDLTRVAAPVLVIPLIIAAIFSQFSAAVADCFGASGNIAEITKNKFTVKKSSIAIIICALVLTWIVQSGRVVTLASQAFALYYLVQCLIALSVTKSTKNRVFLIIIAAILFFITFFSIQA